LSDNIHGKFSLSLPSPFNAENLTACSSHENLFTCQCFISVPLEIVAAKKAGFQTVVTDRPGNAPLTVEERNGNIVVKSFLEIPKPQ
jgi:enolase-phosphatase E1